MAELASYSYSYSTEYGNEYAPLWIIVTINVILIIVTVVGNVMVIVAYIRDAKIRNTIAYTLILNLSITDLLVGLFIFPLNTLWWINDGWLLGELACKVWLIMDYSVLMMSAFTIVFISLDRYWLLTKGLEYRKFQSFRKVIVVLSSAWLITILFYTFIAFAVPLFLDDMTFILEGCELEATETHVFNTLELILKFIIPFSFLLYLNYKVYSNIRERSRGMVNRECQLSKGDLSNNTSKESGTSEVVTIKGPESVVFEKENTTIMYMEEMNFPNSSFAPLNNEDVSGLTCDTGDRSNDQLQVTAARNTSDNKQNKATFSTKTDVPPPSKTMDEGKDKKQRQLNRHRKAAIMLIALVAVFFVCWLPYYIVAILLSFKPNLISERTWEIVSYFQWCNSTINPFIYGFTNVLFRRNFVKFMHLESCINNRYHSDS